MYVSLTLVYVKKHFKTTYIVLTLRASWKVSKNSTCVLFPLNFYQFETTPGSQRFQGANGAPQPICQAIPRLESSSKSTCYFYAC